MHWKSIILGAIGVVIGRLVIDLVKAAYRKWRNSRPAVTGYNEGAADDVLDEIVEEGDGDEVEPTDR